MAIRTRGVHPPSDTPSASLRLPTPIYYRAKCPSQVLFKGSFACEVQHTPHRQFPTKSSPGAVSQSTTSSAFRLRQVPDPNACKLPTRCLHPPFPFTPCHACWNLQPNFKRCSRCCAEHRLLQVGRYSLRALHLVAFITLLDAVDVGATSLYRMRSMSAPHHSIRCGR